MATDKSEARRLENELTYDLLLALLEYVRFQQKLLRGKCADVCFAAGVSSAPQCNGKQKSHHLHVKTNNRLTRRT